MSCTTETISNNMINGGATAESYEPYATAREILIFRNLTNLLQKVSFANSTRVAHAIMSFTLADIGIGVDNSELAGIAEKLAQDSQKGCLVDPQSWQWLLRFSFGEVSFFPGGAALIDETPYFFAWRGRRVERAIDHFVKNSSFTRLQIYGLRDEICSFCTAPAPRDVKKFEEVITDYLKKIGQTLDNFKNVFGQLGFVIQQGADAALLARRENLVHPTQEYWPLDNFDEWPVNPVLKTLGSSFWGNVECVQRGDALLAMKVISIHRVKKRNRIKDHPPTEIATHVYLCREWGNRRHLMNGPCPFIVPHVATTMGPREKLVYYYMEMGRDYFSYIADNYAGALSKFKRGIKQGEFQPRQMSPWEADRRREFAQLLVAFKYMHTLGVAHRDFKLENCIMRPDGTVMIIDFGVAHRFGLWEKHFWCQDSVGTPLYMSPECRWRARRQSDQTYIENTERWNARANDVWTLGIALFMMMFAVPPYRECANSDKAFIFFTSGSFCPPGVTAPPSHNLKQLIRAYKRSVMRTDLLVEFLQSIFVPEKKRITLDQMIQHPWIKDEFEKLCAEASTGLIFPFTSSCDLPQPEKFSILMKEAQGQTGPKISVPEWFACAPSEFQHQMLHFYNENRSWDVNLLLNSFCNRYNLKIEQARHLVDFFKTQESAAMYQPTSV